jgi:hypothetical protein
MITVLATMTLCAITGFPMLAFREFYAAGLAWMLAGTVLGVVTIVGALV